MGVPEKIKIGTKFIVCTHEELIKKGWFRPTKNLIKNNQSSYEHDDYHGVITYRMIEDYQGQTLTVKEHGFQNWYSVDENDFKWPVPEFLSDDDDGIIFSCKGGCEEGQTPILGWFICKHCGIDLRQIK